MRSLVLLALAVVLAACAPAQQPPRGSLEVRSIEVRSLDAPRVGAPRVGATNVGSFNLGAPSPDTPSPAAPSPDARNLDAPMTRADVAAYAGGGTSTLRGQAFLRQDSGARATCAGSEVLLMPDVPWTRQVVAALKQGRVPQMRLNGQRPSKVYPNAFRKKWCRRDGDFRFDRIAGGPWIVLSTVEWTAQYDRHGGVLIGYVDVPEGGAGEIVLSSSHLIDSDRQ